eukprot:2330936-Pyramimonas_sp.AAC.2
MAGSPRWRRPIGRGGSECPPRARGRPGPPPPRWGRRSEQKFPPRLGGPSCRRPLVWTPGRLARPCGCGGWCCRPRSRCRPRPPPRRRGTRTEQRCPPRPDGPSRRCLLVW